MFLVEEKNIGLFFHFNQYIGELLKMSAVTTHKLPRARFEMRVKKNFIDMLIFQR